MRTSLPASRVRKWRWSIGRTFPGTSSPSPPWSGRSRTSTSRAARKISQPTQIQPATSPKCGRHASRRGFKTRQNCGFLLSSYERSLSVRILKKTEETMLTTAANDMLTRVGPGTPMGNLMLEYWIPACLSSELKADGEPMRLMLLGEQLIAFRDTDGRVGVMEHRCPHRRASLFFGRNEEGGLRCIYHGWKFDVEGKCLEMPNVPPQHAFPQKVTANAYKAAERNGVVWVYMGARETAPPLPSIEAMMLPEAETNSFWVQRECNWLQALEGDIDTSHLGFLHDGKLMPEDLAEETIHRWAVANRAPEYDVAETSWGTMYAAHRHATPGNIYYRVAHFLFPCWS